MYTLHSPEADRLLEEAKKEISIADNMFNYTASVADTFRVYLSCIKHLREGLFLISKSLIHNENYFKRINFMPQNEKLLVKTFLEHFEHKLKITLLDKRNINELNHVFENYKSRETGMRRGDSYLIVSPSFEMVSLSKNQINNYLQTTKDILNKAETWLKSQEAH